MEKSKNRSKAVKIIKIVLISVIALWAVALVVIQVALTPSVLRSAVNGLAAEYVDGDVDFTDIRVSVFRNFPYLNVSLDSLSVTYPSDRFAGSGAGSDWYTSRGRGETCDTLMSFSRLSASVNLAGLVAGKINVPRVILSNPRIFASKFADGRASWDVLKLSESEDTVESDSGMPEIRLGKIRLVRNPFIVFSSIPDSLRASVVFRRMMFDGVLSDAMDKNGKIRLKVDSLFLTGRIPTDTVALGMNRLAVAAGRTGIEADVEATTFLATRNYGRLRLLLKIKSEIGFPKDSSGVFEIQEFSASLAEIPLTMSGTVGFADEGLTVKGNAAIEDCRINDVIRYFGKNIWEGAKDFSTDASVTLTASFDGRLGPDGRIPAFSAALTVPPAKLSHKAARTPLELSLSVSAEGDEDGHVDIDIRELHAAGEWVNIDVAMTASDVLGKDPLFDMSGNLAVNLDSLRFRPGMLKDYRLAGGISAELKGKVNLSQLVSYRFTDADISGFLRGRTLDISSPADSVSLYADSIDIWLGATGNRFDRSMAEGERIIALAASVDSVDMNYKDGVYLRGRKLSLMAHNSAAIVDRNDSSAFYPFGGRFEAGFLQLRGADTTSINVMNTANIFTISPKKGNSDVPVLTLTSDTKGMFVRGPVNRLAARNFSVAMTAAMNSIERRQKMREFRDSLARAYPDVPRDSLFAHVFGRNFQKRPMPSWMTEDDFRKNDMDFRLDSSIARYYTQWDIDGKVSLDRLSLISPMFPLRNSVRNLNCNFSNDEIVLKSLTLSSGHSRMDISGDLSHLRRALLHNGPIGLDLNMDAGNLDFNEMFAALAAGDKFREVAAANTDFSKIDDDDYEDMVVMDVPDSSALTAETLIVIPANIEASVSLQADSVKFAKLTMTSLTSDLAVRERCVQFTNTSAMSDMGNLFFEGFYSTRTKKDIGTGFNLNLNNVTAEKVIEMVPQVDSLFPVLKSFKGNLNCEMAATAKLDTSMNIIMPSIDGVIRISGKNLQLQNDAAIKKITKLLRFKDKETSRIDRMSVEGLISDNRLEIFPFVLSIDRYTLAMSGVQNLDSSFKYHISVIESPLLFRMGVDLSGTFDDFKFKIGKAKFKSTDVPVFSTVVDKAKLNLAQSIHDIFIKGAEAAIRENENQQAIADFKKRTGYVQAVDEQLDSLSAEEKAEYEAQDAQ